MISNPIVKQIVKFWRENIKPYEELNALAEWDFETYMPEKAVNERSIVMQFIEKKLNKAYTSRRLINLVERAKKENLNEYERRIVELLDRAIDKHLNVRKELLEQYEKQKIVSLNAWRNAKEKNDFSLFEKELERLLELAKQIAEDYYSKKGINAHLLDFWLDDGKLEDPHIQLEGHNPPLGRWCGEVHPRDREEARGKARGYVVLRPIPRISLRNSLRYLIAA